ncbi:immune inhibitor A [Agromyces sp. SYSU K20354]|uniref:M14 family metallopeptidase n=1 Tax=Agromyces cavernae TaxID=2898659 RepID=UPI001E5C0D2A|nr:M14 family metallopeptidase [Agromyces cavernae]MCD2441465.1 immune inhibitor A [Agromyces cavernae]
MLRQLAVASAAALILTGLVAAPSAASPAPPPGGDDPLAVYTGTVDREGLAAIVDLGVDRHELVATPTAESSDRVEVQVILSGDQAARLNAQGAELVVKDPAAQRRSLQATDGVYRQYYPEGGLLDELMSQAAAHPGIAEFRVIGQTENGNDIGAVRVTGDVAKQKKDGKRPTTLYVGAQHAREWITPEMIRRLLDLYVTSYGSDQRITDIIDSTELWFVPVANPDGYDFSFEPGQRLWRKNLHDNNGDGVITTGDGVDLNRNWATRWAYDNEGSSPNPASETYRGTGPNSEAETQAMDSLFASTTPQFLVNYHSAAELLLHGIGWQVSTPSPDDVIYEAMVGDDANPAVEGYDPDISAELYTTNGDTDTHAQEEYGTLGFTPEMTTCETVSNSIPDDEWLAEDCQSGFNFPDDEELIQAEFEKNIPFALAVAESALDPDDPVSVVDREAEDFRVDSFEVSYGDPQPVAVTAKRSLKAKSMYYSINGGKTTKAKLSEWAGGERYGFENTDYYAEYRGVVTGASPGDSVEVWFDAQETAADVGPGEKPGKTESEHFTYELAQDSGSPVLVLANEDYTGYNPEDPPRNDGLKYLDEHVAALEANGVTPATWDVDAQGVPHDLGVLSHFDGVIWYLGDNRLTMDEEDVLTDTFLFGELPDLAVAERQQYLTMSVRDYLNEGGKLAHAGETTGYFGLLGDQIGGIYYGLDGAPESECVVTGDFFSDCLLLADDFTQYWLGGYARGAVAAEGVNGTAEPFDGFDGLFGGPATVDNPIDEVGSFTVTSERLPLDQFPQFESWRAADYTAVTGRIVAVEGDFAAAATHVDDGYQRLGRTFDLSGVSAGDAPTFEAQIAFATEPGYDNVIVEARPVGTDDWTTLPDLNGGTSTAVPPDCDQGFYIGGHPQLEHYLTLGDPCLPTGSTGEWNSFTGSSGGWIPVAFDLSAYAGGQVEVVVSYVTDPAFGDDGLIVDDTRLVVAGSPSQAEGFEAGFGAWSVLGPPEGNAPNLSDFEIADGLGDVVAVTATPDSLLFGFGLEQLDSDAAREDVVARILTHFAG